jgi:hypothetical protein
MMGGHGKAQSDGAGADLGGWVVPCVDDLVQRDWMKRKHGDLTDGRETSLGGGVMTRNRGGGVLRSIISFHTVWSAGYRCKTTVRRELDEAEIEMPRIERQSGRLFHCLTPTPSAAINNILRPRRLSESLRSE